jgi:ABC-type phosphate transport system substrate-binding protein
MKCCSSRLAGSCRFGPWLALAAFLALIGLSTAGQTEPAKADAFVVIVNADNPATSVDKDRLSKMFLKKVKRWEVGEASVETFDQLESKDVREAFTRAVHGKSISAIKSYWQRMIFSGRDVPPDELDSDADVMSAVATVGGGVGYVSPTAKLVDGVKTIRVTDN